MFLLGQIVQVPALIRPVDHCRADGLEEVDRVAVVATICVIIDTDGRVKVRTDTHF